VTAAELRHLLDIVDRTISRWIDAGLPCKKDENGKAPTFLWRDVLVFLYKRKPLEEGALDGSDSPALERYRTAKAEEAERKNAVEMGLLLPVEEARRQVRAIAHRLRGALEALVKTFPEAAGSLREAFEAAVRELEAEFGLEAVA